MNGLETTGNTLQLKCGWLRCILLLIDHNVPYGIGQHYIYVFQYGRYAKLVEYSAMIWW